MTNLLYGDINTNLLCLSIPSVLLHSYTGYGNNKMKMKIKMCLHSNLSIPHDPQICRCTIEIMTKSELGGRLQAFYGSNSSTPDPHTSPPAEPPDPNEYVSDLISSAPLRELLSVVNKLDEQVQQLDGSAQTLVYNNYSEFLTAADTVHSLNFKRHEQMTDFQSHLTRILSDTWNLFEGLQISAKKVQVRAAVLGYVLYVWDMFSIFGTSGTDYLRMIVQ